MPGSMNNMVYVADSGTEYVVRIDEGNGVAAGFAAYDGTTNGAGGRLPKGVEMRYIQCQHVATGARRRVPVASAANAKFLTGGTISLIDYTAAPVAAADFVITSAHGEKRAFLTAGDTGLLTG